MKNILNMSDISSITLC